MRGLRFVAVFGLGASSMFLFSGCAGNSNPPSPSNGAGGATNVGAGGTQTQPPPVTGGSANTGGNTPSGGGGSPPVADAATEDAQVQCNDGRANNACVSCCSQQHPKGTSLFLNVLTQCACQPMVCGGGVTTPADPDAGGDAAPVVTGSNSCSGECAQGSMMAISSTCTGCIQGAIGMGGNGGPCEAPVSQACDSDAECKALFDCVKGCPQ